MLKLFNFPFFLSWAAIDLIDLNHKLNFGRPGLYGNRSSNLILQNSDLIISIGSRLSIPMKGYIEKEFARDARVVYVDIDKTEFLKFNDKKKFFCYEEDANIFIKDLIINFPKIKKEVSKKKWLDYCNEILKKVSSS